MRRGGAVVAVVCALAFVPSTVADALTTQTFTTSESEFDPGVRNQGWWSPTIPATDSNQNYAVTHSDTLFTRNFFTFDLSSACPTSSVTLELTRFEQSGPLTYSLFDVSTPAATLNANEGRSQTIFDDLGSGTSFGSFPVAGGAPDDVLRFPLNAAGVAAFNATRGDFFSIGGKSPDGEATPGVGLSFLFGFSVATGTQQLIATCRPTTKEECKNGGWRNYGTTFRNQGECVAFVQRGVKPAP